MSLITDFIASTTNRVFAPFRNGEKKQNIKGIIYHGWSTKYPMIHSLIMIPFKQITEISWIIKFTENIRDFQNI